MRQSAISYFTDMVLCPLLAVCLSFVALTHLAKLAPAEWILTVFIGGALWTLIEDVAHRTLYHKAAT